MGGGGGGSTCTCGLHSYEYSPWMSIHRCHVHKRLPHDRYNYNYVVSLIAIIVSHYYICATVVTQHESGDLFLLRFFNFN